MSRTDASQDYLSHYFDIPRYQWLFAVSIGVFVALFLLVGHVGLYHFLTRHRPAFTTQLAVILCIGAPVLVSAMLTVQMSVASYMERFYQWPEPSMGRKSSNSPAQGGAVGC